MFGTHHFHFAWRKKVLERKIAEKEVMEVETEAERKRNPNFSINEYLSKQKVSAKILI